MIRRLAAAATLVVALVVALVVPAAAQEVGRDAVDRLRFPELGFDPPVPVEHTLSNGVTVYLLEDHALPLVDVVARFRGGYSHLGRDFYAAGSALPGMIRAGGTTSLPPDSVEALLDALAVQTTVGGSGESFFSTMNTLTEHLPAALRVWGDMILRPGFDSARVEVRRGRTIETIRRRSDNPAGLAFSEFNRLMFGDHPIGWELSEADLDPEHFGAGPLRELHRRVVCPGNAILGVTGDVTWARIGPLLEALVADWPPCPAPLPDPPVPDIRRGPGVFLIPREIEQSTVVLAQAAALRQGDSPEYFASRIANSILGASGFRSRLVARVRTEEGLAYSVASLWTTPVRYDGVVGATTRTSAETTVEAIEVIQEVVRGMLDAAPEPAEVRDAVDEATHGFVFNFESPTQVIARRISYEAAGLPADWLERYLEGIQQVEPDDVRATLLRHVDPDAWVILVVGDPTRFETPLESLGPVTVIDLERGAATPRPSGSPRSPG